MAQAVFGPGGAVVIAAAEIHLNSHQSRHPSELYHLVNRDTGEIDKIGVTSRISTRYSQAYLARENVRYVARYRFESRYPAVVAENVELVWYQIQHGHLPRLNRVTR